MGAVKVAIADDNKDFCGLLNDSLGAEKDIDIKKNNGKTLTYTYSINISDVDAICYRFDAHGSLSDKYWLRNIRFNAKFH